MIVMFVCSLNLMSDQDFTLYGLTIVVDKLNSTAVLLQHTTLHCFQCCLHFIIQHCVGFNCVQLVQLGMLC